MRISREHKIFFTSTITLKGSNDTIFDFYILTTECKFIMLNMISMVKKHEAYKSVPWIFES